MKKRVLSLLLVMLMVVSLVPTGMIQANAESFQSRLSMTPENAPAYYTTLNPYWGTHKSGGTIIREIIIIRLAKHRLLVR